jgi:hypothetical protein
MFHVQRCCCCRVPHLSSISLEIHTAAFPATTMHENSNLQFIYTVSGIVDA